MVTCNKQASISHTSHPRATLPAKHMQPAFLCVLYELAECSTTLHLAYVHAITACSWPLRATAWPLLSHFECAVFSCHFSVFVFLLFRFAIMQTLQQMLNDPALLPDGFNWSPTEGNHMHGHNWLCLGSACIKKQPLDSLRCFSSSGSGTYGNSLAFGLQKAVHVA